MDEHKAEADTGELFQASTSCYTSDNTAVQMHTPLKYTTSTAYCNHSLGVRRTRLSTVGDRAFPVIGSRFWNTLPVSVTSTPSLAVFRSRLKSYLFERSFPAAADSY